MTLHSLSRRRAVRSALAVSLLALTSSPPGCARDTGPITIGIIGPLSDPLGVAERRAAQLAVEQINARGGVRGGRRLALRIVDDSGSENGAVLGARVLYDDPDVVAIVGHITSGTTIAGARLYGSGRRPVPMVSPSASSPELSGLSPYVFRVCPNDLAHGPALARFARRNLGAKRAGIIYINDDYGRGVRVSFASEFSRLGGVVVEQDPYLPTTASLEPYLERMRSAGVDVLMLATEVSGAELALREMRRLGVQWPVVGSDALVGIETDGGLSDGIHLSSAYLPDRPGAKNATFVSDYARAADGHAPTDVAGLTYDIVNILSQALDAVGADRAAVRSYLATIGGARPAYEGVTGRIVFDAAGDAAGKPLSIALVRGGHLVAEATQ